ncbi:MAG: ATP-binding protein [Eubacteriales bacterium]
MKRDIIVIDEDKCNGCGLCVHACHEGALIMQSGKAKLITESYCDGLGDCLPECPTGAITIEEREADAYDEKAVIQNMAKKKQQASIPRGCPGTHAETIQKETVLKNTFNNNPEEFALRSELNQWPCQIKLVPPHAPYLQGAHLLVAADCTAFAYANIHKDYMKNKITLIGCPKLDSGDYGEKLTEILRINELKSITVLRMEVPCCGGMVNAVKQALINSGKMVPWSVVTLGIDGKIIEKE